MEETYKPASDIEVLSTNFPIPGFGLVPVNAFVLKAKEPVLVDTGVMAESDDFMNALTSAIDLEDLRWIWLTHTDFDHIGSLHRILDAAPQVRVITTFLGVGIMSLANALPMDRVNFVNPGDSINVGDRTLTAIKPPAFDNPSTTGFFDDKSRALFTSDCFGALLESVPQNAADLSEQALREGNIFWTTVDSPWIHSVSETALANSLDDLRKIEPELVLSSHLPAAGGDMMDKLLSHLAAAPGAQPFVGPDQAALEQMLQEMTEGPQPEAAPVTA